MCHINVLFDTLAYVEILRELRRKLEEKLAK